MTRNNRLMFVDDEEGVRVSWKRYFENRGFSVATAPDGASAIEELSQKPADVVVSDLRMPGIDGLQLLEWINERQPDTRFILFTGYGDQATERRARELGVESYLEKPVAPDVLAHAIDVALDPGRLHPALPILDVTPVEARARPEVMPAPVVETRRATRSPLQTMGLVVGAPFLGLAFVVFLPVIGLGALAWILVQEARSAFRPSSGPA